MEDWIRKDWSAGWQPNADAVNGSPHALLRMDNCVLSEEGIVSLRQGSAKINTTAFTNLNVNTLYTATIGSTRYRMSGVTNAVYANGTSILSSIAGSGDIQFGSYLGQIFMARSTTKRKYDGTALRNWGIAAPTGTISVAALAADSATFATGNSTESPAFVANEGTIAFSTDRAGTANAAIEVTPAANTGRGTITKTYASITDFTAYTGGQTGIDDDLIDFYVYVTEPEYLLSLSIMVDVNNGNFDEGYYLKEFRYGETVQVPLEPDDLLAADYSSEAFARDRVRGQLETRHPVKATFRTDKPATSIGWNHFSIARGKMTPIGVTAGKNWSTVQALRLTFTENTSGSGAAIRFDDVKILGGSGRPLTGSYKWRLVAIYDSTTYQSKSAPSSASAELELKASGATITVPAATVTGLDSQVTALWLYRMGGLLDAYYRVATLTGGPFSGAQTISDTTSDRDALITNLRLETNDAVPPDNIVGIEGPHFDRLMALTATHVYPSQVRNPDSFASDEAIRVADASETALWIKKIQEELYIGTTKDIYRFSGPWTRLPDDTINVTKIPLGVGSPPVSAAVATDGYMLIYLAADGWRSLGEANPITAPIDLIWKGYTRHSVSAVNIKDSASRFRAAIRNRIFYAITPEGADTTSSVRLHVYDIVRQRWYRFVYSVNWLSIAAEPDGTLIAGDNAGFVRTLSTGTQDDGTDIPITLWTTIDDNGTPLSRKDPQLYWLRVDTGGKTVTASLHFDGSSTATTAVSGSSSGQGTIKTVLTGVGAFTELQHRFTGNFSTFRLYEFDMEFNDMPAQVRGELPRTAAGYLGPKTIGGIVVRLNTLGATRIFTPVLDGTSQTTFSAIVSGNHPLQVTYGFPEPKSASEIGLNVDGNIELYSWEPIILYKEPPIVRMWDTGPVDIGGESTTWIREVRIRAKLASDMIVTAIFDGTAQPDYYLTNISTSAASIYSVYTGREYKGREPRLLIKGTGDMQVYWIEFLYGMGLTPSERKTKRIPAFQG